MSDAPLAQYWFRRSILEQTRTYLLYDDRLQVEGDGIATYAIPLGDIRMVHLEYEHSKQREYYQCHIRTAGGRINLRHVHWQGFGAFQDRRKTYTPFVKALLVQLAGRPGVKFKAGSMPNFIAALLGIPVMGTLGVLCLWMRKFGYASLAGFFTGLCLIMIGPSRPYQFDPLAPPDDLLPE